MFQIGEVTACSERVDWTPTLVFYNWLTSLFTTLLPSCPTSRTTAILIFPPEHSCSTWGFTTHMRISVLFLVAAPLVLLFSTVSKSNTCILFFEALQGPPSPPGLPVLFHTLLKFIAYVLRMVNYAATGMGFPSSWSATSLCAVTVRLFVFDHTEQGLSQKRWC